MADVQNPRPGRGDDQVKNNKEDQENHIYAIHVVFSYERREREYRRRQYYQGHLS